MMRHPLIAFFLALVLAAGTILSGPALAWAVGSSVELCSDGVAVTVTLDAEGKPVASHRPCPHCLAAQDQTLPPAPTDWSRPAVGAGADRLPAGERLAALTHSHRPFARAPPLPV